MPLNISNAESAYLTATARHKKWKNDFMRMWSQPVTDMMIVAAWDGLPEPMKVGLREQMPEAVKEIEERIEKVRQEVS